MPLPDRISFSAWQAYRNGCQHRWMLDVVEGHRSAVYGVYMDFGTCVHNSIEKYKTRKDPLTVQATQDLFEQKFRELFAKNREKYRDKDQNVNPEDFVQAGRRIIEHLDQCEELRTAEVIYNEHLLQVPIERTDDIKVNFKGYIDLVIKSKDARGKTILYVIDFKTCSWGWDVEKRQDRDLQAQLFLYKHFLSKKFNLDPKQVRTAFVLLKRRPKPGTPAVEFFPVSAGPVSVQRALDAINSDLTDMDQRLREGTIQKDFKKCVNDFGDVCPFKGTAHCPGS